MSWTSRSRIIYSQLVWLILNKIPFRWYLIKEIQFDFPLVQYNGKTWWINRIIECYDSQFWNMMNQTNIECTMAITFTSNSINIDCKKNTWKRENENSVQSDFQSTYTCTWSQWSVWNAKLFRRTNQSNFVVRWQMFTPKHECVWWCKLSQSAKLDL